MTSSPDYFYTTTPIYYVNDKPHIGHAYTTLLADVLSRYHRLLGVPTFFLTGTDEHGQKVANAAKEQGITSQEQCDRTVVRFTELWERLGITHDDFIRTTEERHKVVVREILQDLFEQDEIYRADYEGWYCVPCERFYTEKDLIDGSCPECNRQVEKISEPAYYFRMSKYQDWLIEYINENPEFIQPDFRRNETLGFLRKPLGDLCISRPKTRLDWGIELPFDNDFVCYVWFDALVNYISAIGYRRDDEMFNSWWPASYHLIGKDILTTHTVYWPTMLKAMGVPMPKTVFAHGWWLIDEGKMSKSEGNVVNPMDLCDTYGIDPFRYYMMAEMSLGHDSSYSEESFIERYNQDLAGNLGNMLSRVLKMVLRTFDGRLPAAGDDTADETELKGVVAVTVDQMEQAIHGMKINRGLESIIAAIKACNRYFEQTKPWVLAKEGDLERLGTVLYTAAEALRIISGLLFPVIPEKMTTMREGLGIAQDRIIPTVEELRIWGVLEDGSKVKDVKSLFPRIDVKKPSQKEKAQPKKAEPEGVVNLIDIKEFGKLDLRTAQITEAENIEGSKNLVKLQLRLGAETRQIVGGIAQWYEPADLVGRNIVIIANLKPATIFSVESNGMLLAAKKGKKKLTLITTDDGDFPSGATVG